MQAHQLVVVNPNVIHTEVSFESHPLEYIVLGIEGLEFTISDAAEGSFCIYTFKEDNDVLVCMRKILREMQNRESSFQILCQAYMDIIVVQLMRNASVSAVPIHSRLPANRQCATVKRYIDHHYKENITLDQLAEKVSITKYYMVHAFKREYGVSPINYIINCRIKKESVSWPRRTFLSLRSQLFWAFLLPATSPKLSAMQKEPRQQSTGKQTR